MWWAYHVRVVCIRVVNSWPLLYGSFWRLGIRGRGRVVPGGILVDLCLLFVFLALPAARLFAFLRVFVFSGVFVAVLHCGN